MPVTAPKCKVCGAFHWMRQPHQFSKSSTAPDPQVPKPKTVKAEEGVAARVASSARNSPAMAKSAGPSPGGEKLQFRDSGSARRKPVVRTVVPPADAPSVLAQAEKAAEHLAPARKGPGRPSTGYDKKEADRLYAAKRRELIKAGKLKPKKKKPARKAKA